MKKVLTAKVLAQPSATLERIQSRFEKVRNLVKEAVENKKIQQLRHLKIQLNVLLGRTEALRTQFVSAASLNLPFYIDDEIKYVNGMIKNLG